MTSRSPRLVVSIALVAGLVLGMADFAKDGEPLNEPQRLNTLDIPQGETYEVVFRADNPDTWLLHCHDLHHASNAGQEPGGLVVAITAKPKHGTTSPSPASVTTTTPSPTMAPRDDRNAGHERHARDESLSETEAA